MMLGIVYHMPFWRADDGTLREVEGSFARYVDSLAPYFDHIVLCVPVLREARGNGTPVQSANVSLAPLPHFEGPVHFYPRLPLMLPRLLRFVRGIDLLHCRVPTPAAVFAFAAARLLNRPAFLLVVGDLEALRSTMPYRGIRKLLWRGYTAFEERSVQWMADHALTFANGPSLARKHSRPGQAVVETRTTTITLADLATRDDTCAGSRIRILTVSRIDPRKGLRVLPDVVGDLRARGIDVALDIVGPAVGAPGESERRGIEARAAALGLSDRVRCLGPVPLDQLLPLYREYDVFVLPTLPGEGIPRVLLEAMSAGLPVVTTRVAGIPSLIVHERNGLLVDEPASGAIASALARLVANAPLRRTLIARGYETARAHTLDAQAASMMHDVSARLGVTLRQPAAAPGLMRRT
jgi:glycosyltransferase involved in cell wall biosynthesis